MIAARARHTIERAVRRAAPSYVFRNEATGNETAESTITRVTDAVMAGARVLDAWQAEWDVRYQRARPWG